MKVRGRKIKEYRELFWDTVSDYKYGFRRFLKYQICIKLTIFLVMIPIIEGITAILMKSSGFMYLANELIVEFLLSLQGVSCAVIIMLLSAIIILVELGGMFVITNQVIQNKREGSYYEIVKYNIAKLKKLKGIGGIILIVYFLILTPFLKVGFSTSIMPRIYIPFYIKDVIYSQAKFTILLVIGIIVLAYFLLRYIFALQYIVLNDEQANQGLKKSWSLIKENKKLFMKSMMLIGGITVAYTVLSTIVFYLIGLVILGSGWEAFIVDHGLIKLVRAIYLQGMLIIIVPFQIIFLTKLYYKCLGETPKTIELKLEGSTLPFIDRILGNKKALRNAGLLLVILLSAFSRSMMSVDGEEIVEIVTTAHRGSSEYAPENTLVAIEKAVDNGVDYIEIDVQETKDGYVVLNHDTTLWRTTGSFEKTHELTLEEIKELDAGSWFGEEFEGEQIPTLEEVIEITKGKVKLNIELKPYDSGERLAQMVLDIVDEYDIRDEIIITSIVYSSLEEVRRLAPDIEIGYVMYSMIGNGELDDLDVDFYSIELTIIDSEIVEYIHELGREVHVWSPNEEDDMQRMINLGVDNILTNDDKTLIELLEEYDE